MTPQIQPRKRYLDVLRILASFLVCYNHSFGFELFVGDWDTYNLVFWGDTLLSAFATVNIPLFFMISGALLLGKRNPIRSFSANAFCTHCCRYLHFRSLYI